VSEAQSGWLQSRKVSRAMDRELARTLAGREFEGRTMAWDGNVEKAVSGLDAKTIREAMKKLLNPKNLAIVQVGDFARVAREGLKPDAVPGVAKGAGSAPERP